MSVNKSSILAAGLFVVLYSVCMIVGLADQPGPKFEPLAPLSIGNTPPKKLADELPGKNNVPEQPSPEIITSWQNAGADFGWMQLGNFGEIVFIPEGKSGRGDACISIFSL